MGVSQLILKVGQQKIISAQIWAEDFDVIFFS